jgi:DNA polymerase type B, organellar and viral
MYIPKNPDNILIYCYDVNSLYPSQMLNESMPIGKPVLFYGNIRKVEPTESKVTLSLALPFLMI